MKSHLFYTFLLIFAATAIVTLLGVTNVIQIQEGYLTALVSAFLLELTGAVIAIFKSANFFEGDHKPLNAGRRNFYSVKVENYFGGRSAGFMLR